MPNVPDDREPIRDHFDLWEISSIRERLTRLGITAIGQDAQLLRTITERWLTGSADRRTLVLALEVAEAESAGVTGSNRTAIAREALRALLRESGVSLPPNATRARTGYRLTLRSHDERRSARVQVDEAGVTPDTRVQVDGAGVTLDTGVQVDGAGATPDTGVIDEEAGATPDAGVQADPEPPPYADRELDEDGEPYSREAYA